MKKFLFLSLLAAGTLTVAFADPIELGDNITQWDKLGVAYEDGEVEPGCVNTQPWDLEGVFLQGSSLSMVGGYNFATGQYAYVDGQNRLFYSGDIFLDIDGDAVYGSTIGNGSANGYWDKPNTNGWDYAISLNFSDGTYDIYRIDETATVKTPYFAVNREATPLEYVRGGVDIGSGNFTYLTGKSNAETGFNGGLHNVVQGIDLSFLGNNTTFTSHFTMSCGNDLLIGKGTVSVPEPGTLTLIGIGLLSLAGLLGFRKKK